MKHLRNVNISLKVIETRIVNISSSPVVTATLIPLGFGPMLKQNEKSLEVGVVSSST